MHGPINISNAYSFDSKLLRDKSKLLTRHSKWSKQWLVSRTNLFERLHVLAFGLQLPCDLQPATHYHWLLCKTAAKHPLTIQTNFYIVQVLLLYCFGSFWGHGLPIYQDFERIIFMGRWCQPHAQPPTWRASVYLWYLAQNLSSTVVLLAGRLQPAQLSSSMPHACSLAWLNKPYYTD